MEMQALGFTCILYVESKDIEKTLSDREKYRN